MIYDENAGLIIAATGAFQSPVVEGVEYESPAQKSGIYGRIYRQYHGAKTNGQTVAAVGITKLIDCGGTYDSISAYRGHAGDGTNYISPAKGSDVVTFNINGWTLNDGWIDYIK